MRDIELETVVVGDFRYRRCERVMNRSRTGETYWMIAEVPRIDGLPHTVRQVGSYGDQVWREEYDSRRYPRFVEQIQWPDLATAQLAAVAATGITEEGMGEYITNVQYAARVMRLPETPKENQ
jgi:hypothetical protein